MDVQSPDKILKLDLSQTLCEQYTLNDWSRGKQLVLFPENLNVSRGEAEKNIEIQGKQN